MSAPTAAALLAASASALLAGGVQDCSSWINSSGLSLTSTLLCSFLMKPCMCVCGGGGGRGQTDKSWEWMELA